MAIKRRGRTDDGTAALLYHRSCQTTDGLETIDKITDPAMLSAVASIIMAIFTGTLWWSSRRSFRAAELQTKSFMRAELPLVIAQRFVTQAEAGGAAIPEYPVIQLEFANYGRTPAELDAWCIKSFIGQKLTGPPDYSQVNGIVPGTMLPPNGAPLAFSTSIRFKGDQRAAVMSGRESLWIYGLVRFWDFLGYKHETRFAAMILIREDAFMFVHNHDTPPEFTGRT